MGDYASEVDRINDMVRQHKEASSSGLSDEANSLQTLATENWNSTSADYLSKYSHLAEGGGAELAGAFGLKGIYKGGRQLKGLYDKYKTKTSDSNDPLVENDKGNPENINNEIPENLRPEDVPDIPQTGDAPTISTDNIASEDAFNFIKTEGIDAGDTSDLFNKVASSGDDGGGYADPFTLDNPTPPGTTQASDGSLRMGEPGEPEPAPTAPTPADVPAAVAPETENLVEQVGEKAAIKTGENLGEGLLEKGAASGLGELALGAIPVIGEAALGIAGLVSIGEGIYHLFHHKDKQPVVSAVQTGGETPQQNLTQKYSLALPSIDSASDQSASVSSF